MDKNDIRNRILFLRDKLHKYNHSYYVLANPEVSDYEFDSLLKELVELEKANPEFFDSNSPTLRVGSDTSNSFTQVVHKYPMLSLGNTYSKEELIDFDSRIRKMIGNDFAYVCELKFDGVAIGLTYKNGELTNAVTRGDGVKGDDVTVNVRTIKTIPLKLSGTGFPEEFEIRGEIFMPVEGFREINREREENGEPLFANPRNAAAGSIKLLNSSQVAERPLDCFMYYLLGDKIIEDSHSKKLEMARS